MSPSDYRAALARLGLTPASRATARALGVTVRTSQRYAAGDRSVPPFVEARLALLEGRDDDAQVIIDRILERIHGHERL